MTDNTTRPTTGAAAMREAAAREVERLAVERDFLVSRLTEREHGRKRWHGSSSDDLVKLAFGVRHDGCLPGDQNDLSACYLTALRLPAHLVSRDVIAQLRCGEATVGETAWARENAGWPGTDEFTALHGGEGRS